MQQDFFALSHSYHRFFEPPSLLQHVIRDELFSITTFSVATVTETKVVVEYIHRIQGHI
jgi:hypothetical protein